MITGIKKTMYNFTIDSSTPLPKVKQIVRSIKMEIENGSYKKHDRLLSINEFNEQFKVARDTVEKAYKILKKEGYISSVTGKGYYVSGTPDMRLKILLVFNNLSSFKRIIYESFIKALGDRVKVDLHIHQYSPDKLKESLDSSLGQYHYYVIMPHFATGIKERDYIPLFKNIPADQLMLLDKNIDGYNGARMSVFQDFKNDIYHALIAAADLVDKYKKITVVFPYNSNHPVQIIEGIQQFCKENNKRYEIIPNVKTEVLQDSVIYIVLTDLDLAQLIFKIRKSDFILGKNIGIISFNETVFKELLGITVLTTDFEQMGKTAAELILNKKFLSVKNPFRIIKRNSL